MAINFAAESMQGYNNPEIEIVNVEVDKESGIIASIPFDDIAKILARGVFPIVSFEDVTQGNRIRYIMPLSYVKDNEIVFSNIVTGGTPASPSAICFGLKFSTSGPPVPLRMSLKNGKT